MHTTSDSWTPPSARRALKLVVFTADAGLETRPWWPAVVQQVGGENILLCKQRVRHGARGVAASLARNVRKHGLIFIPYRIAVGLRDVLSGAFTARRPAAAEGTTEVEGWTTIETSSLHDAPTLTRVREWKPDIGFSLGAPILKPALFSIPSHGTVNLHLGQVPDFRGAPPAFWELWMNSPVIGATVHRIDAGLDSGPVIATAQAPLYAHDTLQTATARAEELGVHVVRQALEKLAEDPSVAGQPQSGIGHTFRSPTLTQRLSLWRRISGRRLRRAATPRHLIKTAVGVLLLGVLRPLRDTFRSFRKSHPVRVFTFHRVTTLCRDGMTVTPENFERQLKYIRRFHTVVSIDEAVRLLRSNTPLPKPVAAITFDDGYLSVLDGAAPIVGRQAIPGPACFISTSLVDTDLRFEHDSNSPIRDLLRVLTWDEVKQLQRMGWVFGGHTATHARISKLTPDELAPELSLPLDALNDRLGITDPLMTYPFGTPEDASPDALRAVQRAGYSACFSDYGGENWPPSDCFTLLRIDIGGDHDTIPWKIFVHGMRLDSIRKAFENRPAS